MLCPQPEMAQGDGSFNYSFAAASAVGEQKALVRIEAGGDICMGAAKLICNRLANGY